MQTSYIPLSFDKIGSLIPGETDAVKCIIVLRNGIQLPVTSPEVNSSVVSRLQIAFEKGAKSLTTISSPDRQGASHSERMMSDSANSSPNMSSRALTLHSEKSSASSKLSLQRRLNSDSKGAFQLFEGQEHFRGCDSAIASRESSRRTRAQQRPCADASPLKGALSITSNEKCLESIRTEFDRCRQEEEILIEEQDALQQRLSCLEGERLKVWNRMIILRREEAECGLQKQHKDEVERIVAEFWRLHRWTPEMLVHISAV